ncbi:MAG: hypothetical protein WDO24_21320 [Pseudomonadota bacterium]
MRCSTIARATGWVKLRSGNGIVTASLTPTWPIASVACSWIVTGRPDQGCAVRS